MDYGSGSDSLCGKLLRDMYRATFCDNFLLDSDEGENRKCEKRFDFIGISKSRCPIPNPDHTMSYFTTPPATCFLVSSQSSSHKDHNSP